MNNPQRFGDLLEIYTYFLEFMLQLRFWGQSISFINFRLPVEGDIRCGMNFLSP